jgi:hypothetical protein
MANATNKGGAATGGAATGGTATGGETPRKSLAERMASEGFKEAQQFGQDGVIYSADKCGKAPIIGLLYKQQMLSVTSERPFNAYFFRLLKPGKGVTSDGKVIDVPAGHDLIVPENAKLKQQLGQFFDVADPDHVWAIAAEPVEKQKVERGDMWVWDFARLEKTPRSRRAHMLPQANEVHATKELGQGASEFFSDIAREQNGQSAARA